MKLFRTLLITGLFFIFNYSANAQEMPSIVPPSPEAAQAFKFAEVPISLHTGVPNITIPLFEIASGGVVIPVSLSYHSKGVQVAEVSSTVGTGWTLNASGMITRQVRDNLDEDGYTVKYNGVWTYKDESGNVDFFTSFQKRDFLHNVFFDLDWDYLPDQYYFNLPTGISGKYIFDYKTGKLLPQNYSNVKIEGDVITDGNGNKYYFNMFSDIETTLNGYILGRSHNAPVPAPGSRNVPNTIHLAKIVTQSGKEINFNYATDICRLVRRNYDKLDTSIEPNEYKSYMFNVDSNQKRLTEISYDEGKVVFEYNSSNRLDLNGSKALKAVKLYDARGVLVKSFVLNHTYTNSSSLDISTGTAANIHNYYRSQDSENSYRLFLSSVQEKSANNELLPPYEFEYNEQILPNRHSNSQDVWGYYNGKANGQFLRERYTDLTARAVDTVKSMAGILEKIKYPKGGSVKFYYEHNRVFNPYFPTNLVDFSNSNPVTEVPVNISAMIDYNQNIIDEYTNMPVYSIPHSRYRKTFEITDGILGSFMYYDAAGSFCGGTNPNCLFSAKILDEDFNTVAVLHPTNYNEFRSLPVLEPGIYTLEVDANYNHHPDNPGESFLLSVKWFKGVDSNTPMYAGGKRIKKIEYLDSDDTVELVKTYKYTEPVTGKGSGVLFGLPSFLGISNDTITIGNLPVKIYRTFGSVPGAPLSTYQNSIIGYGCVTEYLGEGNNIIGKTMYRYTMTPDTGLYYEFPYHPPVDNDWLRGKEISVTHYKRLENGGYEKVKEIENQYKFGDIDNTPIIFNPKSYRKKLTGEPLPSSNDINFIQDANYNNNELPHVISNTMFRIPLALIYNDYDAVNNEFTFAYKVFYATGGTVDLLKTKVTDYFEGNAQMQTITDYTYNYNKHYNVSSVSQNTSDGDHIITSYLYPAELKSTGYPQASVMYAKNMKDIPLKTTTYRGAIKTSEVAVEYHKWNTATDTLAMKLAPKLVKTSKGSNALENRLQYLKYDDDGNPLEVKQENGTIVSYIWGYNNAKPVAKIENAQYSQIPTNLIANVKNATNLTANYSEQSVIDALNALRTALPNAMVSTYTYKHQVGVSTITDPRGHKTIYEYDSFGRLEFIKDHVGNILQQTKYNYQN